ncbi:ATP-binding protein, partial [bacterium]|nr:ATP-binding protein [bacterium]
NSPKDLVIAVPKVIKTGNNQTDIGVLVSNVNSDWGIIKLTYQFLLAGGVVTPQQEASFLPNEEKYLLALNVNTIGNTASLQIINLDWTRIKREDKRGLDIIISNENFTPASRIDGQDLGGQASWRVNNNSPQSYYDPGFIIILYSGNKEVGFNYIYIKPSNLQSKYVGDCEKNISLAFEKAKKEDAILFFDEADSLIIDRAISSHSWEKTQTNVLLQEIEKFNGICIFATNILESYDPAIERRISLNLEFKKPGMKLRKKIFENFLNKKDALDEDVNLDILAKDYDFSGGEIKNAIMHALRFAASDSENDIKKIKMKHLKYACGIIEKTRFDLSESFNSQIYL